MIDGWMDRWMDGWVDGYLNVLELVQVPMGGPCSKDVFRKDHKDL
jgi:hypothetical protein